MVDKNISLSELNENKHLIEILKTCEIENKINNKLWQCFLTNDGSMTKMLKILYGENLRLQIISNTENNSKIQSSIILSQIEKLLDMEINLTNPIERKINFVKNDSIIMIGLSYWDSEEHKKIYCNKEDQGKPIGLILIEKEVEYFKIIKNFFSIEYKNFVLRLSIYKINKKNAFVLLELFDTNMLEEFFDKFE